MAAIDTAQQGTIPEEPRALGLGEHCRGSEGTGAQREPGPL